MYDVNAQETETSRGESPAPEVADRSYRVLSGMVVHRWGLLGVMTVVGVGFAVSGFALHIEFLIDILWFSLLLMVCTGALLLAVPSEVLLEHLPWLSSGRFVENPHNARAITFGVVITVVPLIVSSFIFNAQAYGKLERVRSDLILAVSGKSKEVCDDLERRKTEIMSGQEAETKRVLGTQEDLDSLVMGNYDSIMKALGNHAEALKTVAIKVGIPEEEIDRILGVGG